jgi:hypothetical protein
MIKMLACYWKIKSIVTQVFDFDQLCPCNEIFTIQFIDFQFVVDFPLITWWRVG